MAAGALKQAGQVAAVQAEGVQLLPKGLGIGIVAGHCLPHRGGGLLPRGKAVEVRAAAFAGAEPGGLRLLPAGKEAQILPLWGPGGAGGTAIDAGGDHPIVKEAVAGGVTGGDGPVFFFIGHRCSPLSSPL